MTRKKIVTLSCLVLATLLGIASLIALKSMTKPANGSITVGTNSSSLAEAPTAAATISSTFYSTTLPNGFTVTSQTETPNGAQRLASAVATGGNRKQVVVAISVGNLPLEGLSGVGDYNLRTSQSTTYTRTTLPGQPVGAQSFKSGSAPNSLCVFWTANARYYEVAITSDGGDSYESLLPIYGQISNTWQAK